MTPCYVVTPNPKQIDVDVDADGVGNVCDKETKVLFSQAGGDGFVYESLSTKNHGGQIKSARTGTQSLRIGDDVMRRQYKALVSFDTSVISSTANVIRAQLILHPGKVSGNPANLGKLMVDLSAGGFGGDPKLIPADLACTF